MVRKIRQAFLALFEKRTKRVSTEDQAFAALLGKFSQIQYLVDQKATIDVIEKSPVGICITSQDYVYEYVNRAYCDIYGYSSDELVGNKFTIVVPEEHQQALMDLHDQFMSREHELEGEWEVLTKEQERKTILANAAYVVDEHGRPKKITFVLDITRRKRAETELERQRDARETLLRQLREEILPMLQQGRGGECAEHLSGLLAKQDTQEATSEP
jgi:PAS domain S-box-containing protein